MISVQAATEESWSEETRCLQNNRNMYVNTTTITQKV